MLKSIRRGIWEVIIFLLALLWLVPIIVTMMTAMKSSQDYIMGNFWQLPKSFALFSNIAYAWNDGGLQAGFINSVIYGVIGAVLAILIAALSAYALVALKVRAKMFWFMLIYSGTMFPLQMYLIPMYKMYNNFHLNDTHLGLELFYTAISIPFSLFVLRNFYTTISTEVAEVARLDGCSEFRVFWRMFLPLGKAPAAVLFLFQFTFIWNDLIFGMALSTSQSVRPVMVGMAEMQGIYSGSSMPSVLAGALVISIPTILFFIFLRKQFMQGLSFMGN